MEETRRRNEASMARKRANAHALNPAAANAGLLSGDGTSSPSTTGAMDSLLEKLRAAAPQARDQRDRRRRARLKDRHQVRLASGQSMPNMTELASPDTSPTRQVSGDAVDEETNNTEVSIRDDDVADRAATMLQGLRDTTDPEGSLRVQRRRESVHEDRQTRRRRRGRESAIPAATGSAESPSESTTPPMPSLSLPASPALVEPSLGEDDTIVQDNGTSESPAIPSRSISGVGTSGE